MTITAVQLNKNVGYRVETDEGVKYVGFNEEREPLMVAVLAWLRVPGHKVDALPFEYAMPV